MTLGDSKYFDACVYTSDDGRRQLRVAALVVAEAVLGYSTDITKRRDALMFQASLRKEQGALDLCNTVRSVWQLGIDVQNTGNAPDVDGIAPSMAQLNAVAKNVYEGGNSGGFPWLTVMFLAAVGGGGYYAWRRYGKHAAPHKAAGVDGARLLRRDADSKQLRIGCRVEREHTTSRKRACNIALDHLAEDPSYYSKLRRAGLDEF